MQPYPSAHKTDQKFVEFLCEGLSLLVRFSQYECRLAKVPLYSVDCPLTWADTEKRDKSSVLIPEPTYTSLPCNLSLSEEIRECLQARLNMQRLIMQQWDKENICTLK